MAQTLHRAGWVDPGFASFKEVSGTDASTKTLIPSGWNLVACGTGIADLVVGAPFPGQFLVIKVVSRTSGTVVVTCPAGVTWDGTNNTATFDAVGDELWVVPKSPTEYKILVNTGSVALSSV